MPVSVFIVDSHELVQRGLVGIVDDEPGFMVAGAAGCPREAIDGVAETQPDVVILDLSLTGEHGIELCTLLGAEAPAARIVARCAGRDDVRLPDALLAGASGYVVDSDPAKEIVDRVRSAHQGEVTLESDVASDLFERLRSEEPARNRRVAELTAREQEILTHVAEGLTNRQIGEALHLSPKTVKNYVSGILKKLGMHSRVEAAVFATRLAATPLPA